VWGVKLVREVLEETLSGLAGRQQHWARPRVEDEETEPAMVKLAHGRGGDDHRNGRSGQCEVDVRSGQRVRRGGLVRDSRGKVNRTGIGSARRD
jgi:hypothetical protein